MSNVPAKYHRSRLLSSGETCPALGRTRTHPATTWKLSSGFWAVVNSNVGSVLQFAWEVWEVGLQIIPALFAQLNTGVRDSSKPAMQKISRIGLPNRSSAVFFQCLDFMELILLLGRGPSSPDDSAMCPCWQTLNSCRDSDEDRNFVIFSICFMKRQLKWWW